MIVISGAKGGRGVYARKPGGIIEKLGEEIHTYAHEFYICGSLLIIFPPFMTFTGGQGLVQP